MFFLYNTALRLFTLLILPLMPLILLFVPKIRRRLGERLGWFPRKVRDAFQDMPRPRVWFHAASMGEITAISPVVATFKERNPSTAVVVSTATLSGLEQAQRKLPCATRVFLLPLDYPSSVRRVLKLIEPNLLVIAETEIWPNLVRLTKRTGSQIALVNGRLSERSSARYRWIRGLLQRVLAAFDLLAVQTEQDAERFRRLGANPQRLKVIGNVKFDVSSGESTEHLRQELRLSPGQPVWVAGSTRPGEEEIVFDAFALVQAKVPNAVLIVAPRHLDRLRDVERLLTQRRMSFTYRSHVAKELLNFPVIILDTMGELASAYGLGQVAFVGGSLQPFGGHNPLEPASQGVPVLVGPHMEHFSVATELLIQHGGVQVVTQAQDLSDAVLAAFTQPESSRAAGEKARQAVVAFQGASVKTVELLQKLLLIKSWGKEVNNWRKEASQNVTHTPPQETLPDDWPTW